MSNSTFNALRWIAQYLLPGLGTLYFAIAQIWELPYGEQVLGTISALTIFLGGILGVSRAQYNAKSGGVDGELQIDTTDPDKDIWSLVLNTPLAEIEGRDNVALRVARRAKM